ncbi:hypothetical protein BDN72DRAFT_964014 [Pluteus cervinus]|uniref:Uncharacterized protein n=1 Tax=Pluteus cervinus TaxID=181527 RepID=A0ACD3ACZ1_9AGAR|nr:hypothetical protein BDN72DRAFT_964014 [Pluteus cervinus]
MTLGINDIPEDILVDIFLAIPPYRWGMMRDHSFPLEFLRYPRPVYLKRPPWAFAHVCRRWSQIVRTRPKLWSYIPSIDLAQPTPFLEPYLELAQHSPLSLYLWTSIDSIDELIVDAATFSLLSDRVERWEEVVFNLPHHALPNLDILAGSFNSLKVLHIINQTSNAYLPGLFADAPVLEELTFLVFGEQPALPPSLRKYHTYWPGSVDAAKLLASAPQLVACCFTSFSVGLDMETTETPPPVFMPNLQSLKLEECWDDADGQFLNALTLPQLRNLHLILMATYKSLTLPQVIQMLRRSNASLRTFTLELETFTEEIECLRTLIDLVPDLEYYHWSTMHMMEADENAIFGMFADPQVLPKLKTLIFDSSLGHAYSPDELRKDVITDVLRARASGGYRAAQTDKATGSGGGCLEYLSLAEVDLSEETKACFLDWAPEQDSHFSHLAKIRREFDTLQLFACPPHEREETATEVINEGFQYIVGLYKEFHVQAILSSGIHIVLLELLLRGTSYPPGDYRAERDWIPQIEPVVEYWKSKTRSYVTRETWFIPHQWRVYWVADNQMDAYNMLWSPPYPSELCIKAGCRSMPTEFVQPEIMPCLLPDWERAEHSPRSYAPCQSLSGI